MSHQVSYLMGAWPTFEEGESIVEVTASVDGRSRRWVGYEDVVLREVRRFVGPFDRLRMPIISSRTIVLGSVQ